MKKTLTIDRSAMSLRNLLAQRRRRRALTSVWLATVLGYAVTGCDAPTEENSSDFSARVDATPANLPSQTTPVLITPVSQLANPNQTTTANDPEAEKFWNLLANYTKATAYSDQAEVILSYRNGDRPAEDRAQISVRYKSPDRIEVVAYDARLIGDSQFIWSWVLDPNTNNYDNQVGRRPSPAKLTLESILADQIWSEGAAAGLAGPPPQLTWLFVAPPQAAQRPVVKRLEDATLEQTKLSRFAMGSGDEQRIFWCDLTTGIIRRIEMPAPPSPGISDVRLVVEFKNAQFRYSDQLLIASIPEDRRTVHALVPPPAPIAPLLGTKPAAFELTSHDSRLQISSRGHARPVVLAWFADHPASRAVLTDLQRFADNRIGKVDVLAVMAEPAPTRDTGQLLRSWNIGLAWCNDSAALGRDVFRIQEAPTLIVLDANGTVEFILPRWSDQIVPLLAKVLEELDNGRSPGKDARRAYEKAVDQYRRQVEAMTVRQ